MAVTLYPLHLPVNQVVITLNFKNHFVTGITKIVTSLKLFLSYTFFVTFY